MAKTARSRVSKQHIAPPASGAEIRTAIGVTPKDSKVVRKVMTDLGYFVARSAVTGKLVKVGARARRPIEKSPK